MGWLAGGWAGLGWAGQDHWAGFGENVHTGIYFCLEGLGFRV